MPRYPNVCSSHHEIPRSHSLTSRDGWNKTTTIFILAVACIFPMKSCAFCFTTRPLAESTLNLKLSFEDAIVRASKTHNEGTSSLAVHREATSTFSKHIEQYWTPNSTEMSSERVAFPIRIAGAIPWSSKVALLPLIHNVHSYILGSLFQMTRDISLDSASQDVAICHLCQ
jgi:hypothetical protein